MWEDTGQEGYQKIDALYIKLEMGYNARRLSQGGEHSLKGKKILLGEMERVVCREEGSEEEARNRIIRRDSEILAQRTGNLALRRWLSSGGGQKHMFRQGAGPVS